MRAVVVIPARYASSRYPGKPLVSLLGVPMVVRVAELAAQAVGKGQVYVATDDDRIEHVVAEAGFQVERTSSEALTGTDRVAEAARQIDADIYLNVQGDEPLIDPTDISRIAMEKARNMDWVINGFNFLGPSENPLSRNIPKLVTDEADRLLYMSRSVLPGTKAQSEAGIHYKKQVCIYAFSRPELDAFIDFGRKSVLEQVEDIEILRFFELGCPVRMVETKGGSLAVDEPGDVAAVEAALRLGL
jgi:3-deoxy-manno-octulosonate cytidylyltransferase (CMP-KDO synthetase)